LSHQLDGAFARIDRAREHLAESIRFVDAFREGYHNARTVIFNSEHSQKPDLVIPEQPLFVPQRVSILVGEICYNLRAAMDYLVYELALLDSGRIQEFTKFPICDRKEIFDRQSGRDLKGLNSRHKALIEALQPYNGNDWTRRLREISNPDKHRTLTASGYMGRAAVGSATDKIDFPSHKISTEHGTEGPNGLEVKVPLVTAVTVLISVENRSIPVVEALEVLQSEVSSTLDAFKPEFD